MLDIKRIREDKEGLEKALSRRGTAFDLSELLDLDKENRRLLTEVESLKNERNVKSKAIGELKKSGQDATIAMEEVGAINDKIKASEDNQRLVLEKLTAIMQTLPNVPEAGIPDGGEENFRIERTVGEVPQFDFTPKAHWDLGQALDILDFERAGKVTGARFTFYKGLGARLERALISFMIDMHTDHHGYIELLPPYMVNSASAFGTGQLPKFSEDMFRLEGVGYYLIPTAEVPVTNYHRDEILPLESLPVKYCAYSPCFRSEAGSAGRDTRGIIRQHQFHKVEMVKLAHPDTSFEELESLTANAEAILKALDLPYRVITLASGDIGFSSAKTYDVEVYMPSYEGYREISSCSNFLDFQARRANLRFRDEDGKLRFVHTLNGSGLAIGRTVAAILENCQDKDGRVHIPKALVPYMHGYEVIE